METSLLNSALALSAELAANRMHQCTRQYWHVHTKETRKDQPNERNLTNHFVFHLANLLEGLGESCSIYFEATVETERLDCLLYLNASNRFILIEAKHLFSQTDSRSFVTDIEKMKRIEVQLKQRQGTTHFTRVILSDNYYDQYLSTWENEIALAGWQQNMCSIRSKDDYQWRFLLAFTHVTVA